MASQSHTRNKNNTNFLVSNVKKEPDVHSPYQPVILNVPHSPVAPTNHNTVPLYGSACSFLNNPTPTTLNPPNVNSIHAHCSYPSPFSHVTVTAHSHDSCVYSSDNGSSASTVSAASPCHATRSTSRDELIGRSALPPHPIAPSGNITGPVKTSPVALKDTGSNPVDLSARHQSSVTGCAGDVNVVSIVSLFLAQFLSLSDP
uniref:Ovule protein n=1 Tax=Mesocestoides corti TaxID=53468 RepID=A0A5K3FKY4_MESCO